LVAAQTDAATDSIPDRWREMKDYTEVILHSSSIGIEYRIKAGVAIGGALPLPIPLEIQKIKSYNPLLHILLEAEVMKTFTEDWGVSVGLRMETKGMKTHAEVKNYQLKIVADDGELEGVWTGKIETRVNNSYLTLPVLAVWKPDKRWGIKAGLYASYLLEGNFSGYAYDGYIREGSPVGEKIEVDRAIYDFSSDLLHWNWGVQLGAEWRAFPHLLVALDLTGGINSIFQKDFEVITYKMYPLYLTSGFAYSF
jgi:hypothetical protein